MRFHVPMRKICRRLARDRSGAAAIIFAVAVPVMLGFAGLGIEVGSWFMEMRAMQGAADAAAASAATVLANNGTVAEATTEADTIAAMNGWVNNSNGVKVRVNSPPRTGNFTTDSTAVEVIITRTATNWFSGFLPGGFTAPKISSRGVAMTNPSQDCILSLDPNAGIGVEFFLVGLVTMPNCSIASNSQGSNALLNPLLVLVTAYTATVYGGISSGPLGLPNFNWTRTPIQNKGTVTPDPYACPGTQCRTMPAATVPTAIVPLNATAYPAICAPGTTITASTTLTSGGCYKGINVGSGTATITTTAGTAYTIISPASPAGPAISVTGGIVQITNGGNFTILGNIGEPAISVAATGTLSIGPSTNMNIIQGGSGQPAITMSGGTVTFGSGTNNILGGSGGAGINITGGALAFSAGTNTVEGGSARPAINLSGIGTPTLTFGASTNYILAGAGSSAIVVNPISGDDLTVGGRLTFGNGTNSIQGAVADAGRFPAMTIGGFGHVVFGNGNAIIGCVTCDNPSVPAVIDDAGFLAGLGLGLVLGSGTFQFMEGINVTGGDLTLNPGGAGIGYYIMDGGGSTGTGPGSGFNMTFGDLTGTNATVVLTGGAAGGVGAGDYANINFNGANGMTLTAPTTGNTAGIAIFQDRAASSGNANTIYGITFDNITGAIYTPNQQLVFEGLNLMNSRCLQLIAYTVKILGLTFINDECLGTGTAPIDGNSAIILAE